VPINAVAINTNPGASASTVADDITKTVPGTKGYTLSSAIANIPGVSSVSQTFGILVGLTFIIGIVVIGFFFLILTVQKMKVFTLLRASGASTWRLTRTVSLQITAVVFLASIVSSLLTYGALQGVNTGIPVSLSPALVLTVVIAVWIFSLLTGLLSVRRISAIDPASAAGAR
jgi:putative ABC transport system permease protein